MVLMLISAPSRLHAEPGGSLGRQGHLIGLPDGGELSRLCARGAHRDMIVNEL